ncbi:DASH complex subunit Ask1-domain-containing protein [Protomyces lactucae-debilis]|uniref:DASH complex subunit ASK1 n=1 Tax=Protomyces lactucae-debilis TaxID=2754530 RepID=A0A1Y2F6S3_PROLT|nr:DASH complex subunit Ask1-domain-containing protein [Protomyces lactucae-debilis]ORY79559.1 DASH complex subunit Ask1-domain-containing protein [Protomyces lactucae-debilis]
MASDLERLERLEQSITQLLYSIDGSFAASHRIITASILPIVEQYAEHSAGVWQHAKFWKEFFEQSASVTVSGYVETPGEYYDGSPQDASMLDHEETRRTPIAHNRSGNATAQSPLDLTGEEDSRRASDEFESRLELQTPLRHAVDLTTSSPGSAPEGLHQEQDESSTPTGSPSYYKEATPMTGKSTSKRQDKLLHRVLDTNWRVQATPLKSIYHSTSPIDSPHLSRDVGRMSLTDNARSGRYDDMDDDVSSMGQASPPVTMAFSLPPSKLLRTPAKEAARHMSTESRRWQFSG